MMFLIFLSLLAATWFLLRFRQAEPSALKSLTKTSSVAGLVAAAAVAGGPWLLIGALALGAVGDYFLSRSGEKAFRAGLAAFAVSHLGYIALFLQEGSQPGLVASAIMTVFAAAMAVVLWSRTGALRGPVMIYIGIIATMGILALGLPQELFWATLAALAFVASDTVLALELFVLPAQSSVKRLTSAVLWVLYWGAQAGFCWVFASGSAI